MMVRCSRATNYAYLQLNPCHIIKISSQINLFNISSSSSSSSSLPSPSPSPCTELHIADDNNTTTTTTTTITTTTTTTITVNDDEYNKYNQAQIPMMYYEIENKLKDFDINRYNKSNLNILYNEIIILWKQCIDNKILNWRNNWNLVSHCFELHKLYNDKYGHYTFEYISLITHILSNSSYNKDRMSVLLKHLSDAELINILSFEILIKSCYNEYTGNVMRVHCTGDSNLAYYIYQTFKHHQIKPNETIINELLTTCLKRGDINLAFEIFFELITVKIDISRNAILKLYDICCIKHSIYFGDILTKNILNNKQFIKYRKEEGFVINNYLRICSVSGNLYKALHAIKSLEQRDMKINLISINLLLRTLNTNAQIYDNLDNNKYVKKEWNGILPKNHKLYKDKVNNNRDNPQWRELINPSIEIISDYKDIIINDINNEYLIKIIDRLAFFGSRFEEKKTNFLSIYRYIFSISSYNDNKFLYNSSIIGNLLRGFNRHKLYLESIKLWQIYTSNKQHFNNIDNKIHHPYIIMIRICSYNLSRFEFRNLGSNICSALSRNNYFNQQRLFDAALNFWSGNDKTSVNFLDIQETKTMFKFKRTSQSYCALLRCSTKNNDLQKSLKYIDDIECGMEDMNNSENLIRIIFNTYYHFKLYDKSLILLRDCIYKYNNKYLIKNGIFCVIKTYIDNEKYNEILDIMLNKKSDIFNYCWIDNIFINNDDITLLMYCCYKCNNLDLALYLFELSIAQNLTNFSIVTYNYFIQLLITRFGQFSEVVIDTVSQFLNDNIYSNNNNNGVLNIYEMSSEIIPIVLNCFISKCKEDGGIHTIFNIVCCPNFINTKTFRRDNYRLLSGEDTDYLLSVAHYHLQNYYYPPIECKWIFGHDEINCDCSNFINAL